RYIAILSGCHRANTGSCILLLDLRTNALIKPNLKGIPFPSDMQFASIVYEPNEKRAYVMGGVHSNAGQVIVSNNIVSFDFDDYRLERDIFHIPSRDNA